MIVDATASQQLANMMFKGPSAIAIADAISAALQSGGFKKGTVLAADSRIVLSRSTYEFE